MTKRARLLSIIFSVVAGVLIAAIVAGTIAVSVGISSRRRGSIAYGDIEYTRPDFDALDTAFDSAITAVEGGSARTAVSAMNAASEMFNELISAMGYANIEYQKDYTDEYWSEEYAALSTQYTKSYADYYEMLNTALDRSDADTIFSSWSLEEKRQIREEYESTSGSGYVEGQNAVSDIEREYTGLTTSAGMGTSVYRSERTAKEYSDRAGELLIELAETYNEMYDGNYIEYAYSSYGRDYLPAAAANMRSLVKRYLGSSVVDIYESLGDAGYVFYISASVSDDLTESAAVRDFLADVCSAEAVAGADSDMRGYLTEAYDYMRRYDLYYRSTNKNGNTGAFTTYLSGYNMPYLFQYITGSAGDISTFVHEFGHFASYYLSGPAGGADLDVAEVQSQALELMLANRYDELYGGYVFTPATGTPISGSEAADVMLLGDMFETMFYSVVMGCVMDELQYDVYTDTDSFTSGADVTAHFAELLSDYGITDEFISDYSALLGYDYDYLRYWWAGVPHTFESPFYYISYAMSAVPALTIYIDSTSDFTAAAAEYNYIQRYASEYDDFRTLYADAGISDPFTAATYIEIDDYIDELRGA